MFVCLFVCLFVARIFSVLVVRFSQVPSVETTAESDDLSGSNSVSTFANNSKFNNDYFNNSALRNNLYLSNSSLESLSEKSKANKADSNDSALSPSVSPHKARIIQIPVEHGGRGNASSSARSSSPNSNQAGGRGNSSPLIAKNNIIFFPANYTKTNTTDSQSLPTSTPVFFSHLYQPIPMVHSNSFKFPRSLNSPADESASTPWILPSSDSEYTKFYPSPPPPPPPPLSAPFPSFIPKPLPIAPIKSFTFSNLSPGVRNGDHHAHSNSSEKDENETEQEDEPSLIFFNFLLECVFTCHCCLLVRCVSYSKLKKP